MSAAPRPDAPHCRAARDDHELALANELIAAEYGPVDETRLRWHLDHGDGYPGWRREHTRMAFIGNRPVATLCINSETIRVGEARLRCGALGMLSVADDFRRRGLPHTLIESAMAYLREHQYPVAVLSHAADSYQRLGFAEVFRDHDLHIDPFGIEATGPGAFRIRACAPSDLPAILAMHQALDESTACSVVRTVRHLAIRWQRWSPATVLIDPRGRVEAYFLPRPGAGVLTVEEFGLRDTALMESLLAACAQAALDADCGRIRFRVPPGHPLHLPLATHPARIDGRDAAAVSGLFTVLDVGEALESLLPEWEQRIQDAGLADADTEVTMVVGRAAHRVRAHRGAVDVTPAAGRNKVGVGPAELAALIAGTTPGSAVIDAGLWAVTAEARALFTAIFPPRTPWIWPQDRF